MFHGGRVILKGLKRVELPGQFHLIIKRMNPTVTQPAYVDAPTEVFPGKVFFEIRSPVHFPGNQMMKSQGSLPPAQAAFPGLNLLGIHDFISLFSCPAGASGSPLIRPFTCMRRNPSQGHLFCSV